MNGIAWAQGAAGGAQGGLNGLLASLPMVLMMVAVFYLIAFRPQQLKAKEHKLMLANLKKNDEIITNGGLYGRIMALADNVVTIEIAPNVKVRVSREQISTVVLPVKAVEKSAAEKEKEKSK
jgi:preprotein translocase subunit YajC